MHIQKTLFIALFALIFNSANAQNNAKMNLIDLHNDTTGVQTNMMFPAKDGKVISLQILKGNQLKEHITKVPAVLICVTGKAIYEDENGQTISLQTGDFFNIEPNVKHWVNGIENTNLLLIK